MDKSAGQTAAARLYPRIEPFDRRMMEVGDGHTIYVEQCGARDGIPVIVLHGGPGGGCSPVMRRYFDPRVYRVILFDQRGCGRSRPHAEVEANTTWHLVEDIETIREALGIDRWVVFGGSWGATLALIYAITHPERVAHLALRGVFLMTKAELDWFYAGGAGAFWPGTWARFAGMIPQGEQHDLIGAYHKRLFSGDPTLEVQFARPWAAWENALASAATMGRNVESPGDYARAFARLENHYFTNLGWLDGDDWIIRNAYRLADVPGHIVHGAQDMICLPGASWRLARAWPRAKMRVIPGAAHALSEPGISAALLRVMDALRDDPVLAGL